MNGATAGKYTQPFSFSGHLPGKSSSCENKVLDRNPKASFGIPPDFHSSLPGRRLSPALAKRRANGGLLAEQALPSFFPTSAWFVSRACSALLFADLVISGFCLPKKPHGHGRKVLCACSKGPMCLPESPYVPARKPLCACSQGPLCLPKGRLVPARKVLCACPKGPMCLPERSFMHAERVPFARSTAPGWGREGFCRGFKRAWLCPELMAAEGGSRESAGVIGPGREGLKGFVSRL